MLARTRTVDGTARYGAERLLALSACACHWFPRTGQSRRVWRGRQCIFNSHPALDPVVKRRLANSAPRIRKPILGALALAERFDPTVVAPVSILLPASSPSAVVWAIRPVVVVAFDGQSRPVASGYCPRLKDREIRPLLTHADAPTAVVVIPGRCRSFAPVTHRPPDRIQPCPFAAVLENCSVLLQNCSTTQPETPSETRSENNVGTGIDRRLYWITVGGMTVEKRHHESGSRFASRC